MKTITKDTFAEEVSTGRVMVKLFREKGCSNCEKMKPVFESFSENHKEITCLEMNADENKDIVQRFAPEGQWNLPLFLSFENGKLINRATALQKESDLLNLTKTLQNVTDIELQQALLDVEAQKIDIKKQLLTTDIYIAKIQEEIAKREKGEVVPKVEPFKMPVIVDPADDTQCESCQ